MPSECFKRLQQWTGVGQGSLPQGHPPTKRGRGRKGEGEEEGAHQKDVAVEVFAVCICLHRCHRFWSLNLTATASRTTRAGRKGIKGYTEYTQTHTYIRIDYLLITGPQWDNCDNCGPVSSCNCSHNFHLAKSQRVVEPNMPNELQSTLESAATHAPETATAASAAATCGNNMWRQLRKRSKCTFNAPDRLSATLSASVTRTDVRTKRLRNRCQRQDNGTTTVEGTAPSGVPCLLQVLQLE